MDHGVHVLEGLGDARAAHEFAGCEAFSATPAEHTYLVSGLPEQGDRRGTELPGPAGDERGGDDGPLGAGISMLPAVT